ncbi:MAG: hypothetical protein AB7F35_14775 [Acetobacteraceae bacterium]
MAETDMLVGSWKKSDSPPCAALYPAVLSFQVNGLYRGQPEPPREFTNWDVGTWKLVDPGQIAISTANDAVVTYAFTVSGDALRFTDRDGCQFAYRRDG